MPILADTNCRDREAAKAAFLPFARPDYVEGMVIGDDLDSLLSAMYLHQLFEWPVVGVYCQYSRLWHTGSSQVFWDNLLSGRYVAVDLDIYHPAVPSLGHHIISRQQRDELPGHTHTLNPNALRGFSVRKDYTRKYPLATIHYLWWLFGQGLPVENVNLLIWLADSAYINAQQYRNNVEEWVRFFGIPAFSTILPALQTRAFEQALFDRILRPMGANPLCHPGRSRNKSQHLGLNGYQCQFEDPNKQNGHLRSLLDILSRLSGWAPLPFPSKFGGFRQGNRKEIAVRDLEGVDFSEWLERNGVFSYAFTYRERLNYTVLQ